MLRIVGGARQGAAKSPPVPPFFTEFEPKTPPARCPEAKGRIAEEGARWNSGSWVMPD